MTPDEIHTTVLTGLSRLANLMADATADRWLSASLGQLRTVDRDGQPADALPRPADAALVVSLRNSACAVLFGRRRILERHAPEVYRGETLPFCEHHGQSRTTGWPCDEYLDAAADLYPKATP